MLLVASVLLVSTVEAQIKRPQPQAGPMPTVHVQQPKEFKLKNGLQVLIVEDHKLPRVSYTLTVDVPPYVEGDKKGVSSLTSALVGNGTLKTPKDKFNEEIDFLGANISFWSSGAAASGLSKYSDRILELMAEGALYPLFTQEDFKTEQENAIEGLKNADKSVSTIASRVENALLWGKNHPNGEFTTEETLRNITLEDVKQNYKDYFVPEKAYLIIVGDVDYKKVKKSVKKLFKNWKKAPMPQSNFPEPVNVNKTQIDFVDMPNAVQSEIALVNTYNLPMSHPDYFPLLMANQILGGGGEGRLFLNLREEHGWTYGAYSSAGANKYPTKFRAAASVRNTVTDSAVVEFMNEIHKVRTTVPTTEELKLAKAKFIGNFVMETQKPGTIASFALRTRTQNLPSNFYENFIQNINKVTPQDVQRVANKYFLENNLRIVVAGKGADVADALEKLPYQVNYYDRFANQVERPVFTKPIPAGITSKTVIENHIIALGGTQKLKAVKSLAIEAKGTFQGMEITLKTINTSDGRFMMSLNGMGMELMKQVVTPTMGYISAQGQRQELTGDDLKEAQEKTKVTFSELYDLENADTFELTSIETFNGEDVYVLKKEQNTVYYNTQSGLKVASTEAGEIQGQSFELISTYGDYKEIKGVKIPHTISLPLAPGMEVEFKTTSVKIDEGVSDADFK